MRNTFIYGLPERAKPVRSRPPVRVHPAGITGGTAIDTETRESGPVDLTGMAALRSVLRIRPFRRLWLVLGLASFGDWIGLLAPREWERTQLDFTPTDISRFPFSL